MSWTGGQIYSCSGIRRLQPDTETMPQPTDELTGGVFWMTMVLFFGMPLLGWVVTIIAMRFCTLGKEEMVEVQKRIAEKKTAMLKEG